MATSGSEGWTPDAETILWCFGRANLDTVMSTMRSDASSRLPDLEPWSDDTLRTIADMAIEATLFDLFHQARKAGTRFPE